MMETTQTMAQQVAQAAIAFQQQRTGHAPQAVTVVLSGDTLVITLHGALTPAEQALATNPVGAAKVQEFHRQLFADSSDELRQAIKRITGVEVREAATEVETKTGTVVHAFTNGTMVQVFLLADELSAETWSGSDPVGSLENL
ncbi:MAG: Na-translocating system protein MpsC family protein [Phycisphaerales bacterium]